MQTRIQIRPPKEVLDGIVYGRIVCSRKRKDMHFVGSVRGPTTGMCLTRTKEQGIEKDEAITVQILGMDDGKKNITNGRTFLLLQSINDTTYAL